MKLYLIIAVIFLASCTQKPDFKSFPKIDAHVHLETADDSFIKLINENNIKLMTLVTGASSQVYIDEQFEYASELNNKHREAIAFATTFTMQGFGESGWQEKTIEWLTQSFENGAIAVKVWKDIGMTFRDKDSSFILIDDKRFDPIWDFIESQNITLVNHNGEPKNCWLPLDKMTVEGDVSYYTENTKYHMYLYPEYPSYEELLAARDRMLKKHPNIRYVGCHLGSLEWSVDEQAKWFDEFPMGAMDMADRIGHLKIQDRDKVREFVIKYQDRLLYGTDIYVSDGESNSTNSKIEKVINNTYKKDWEYFTTNKIVREQDGAEYKCLDLPVSVLRKIYSENALRMYPRFEK